jgi:hypothetical protein
MPEGDDLQKIFADPVVEKVSNSGEIQPADCIRTHRLNPGAYPGFFNEQGQGSLHVLANGSRGCGPVFGPPSRCPFNLPLRAGLDADD